MRLGPCVLGHSIVETDDEDKGVDSRHFSGDRYDQMNHDGHLEERDPAVLTSVPGYLRVVYLSTQEIRGGV